MDKTLTPVTEIPSITKGPRQSNFELLRIIAMFLVLVVHADFWTLGGPDAQDFISNPLNAVTRTVIESISIVCVNVFVLISGWFGIRASLKSYMNFIFQCAYFLFGIYICLLLMGRAELNLEGIAGCFCLLPANWFIKAYTGLYILSPVINDFLKKATRKQMKTFLICFYLFQSIWGWSGGAMYIQSGYSCFSFIGLYILAHYLRFYGSAVYKSGGVIYLICIALISLQYYLVTSCINLPQANHYGKVFDTYAYVNPLVVIASCGLLMWFGQLRIKTNKTINWIAKSAFAVFLLHTNPNVSVSAFAYGIGKTYYAFKGIEVIFVIFGELIAVYILAVLLDQPRKWIWNCISKRIFK